MPQSATNADHDSRLGTYDSGLTMLDHDILKSVAAQMMTSDQVILGTQSFPVTRTGSSKLRAVRFVMNGHNYHAIEQNPAKPSRWAELARQGHRVVQFRNVASGKYVAVVVDDKVTEYT
jgi:hypothetical protein